ncbi:ATP-binding protein [Marinobacteraceae bacterium S3BR75-40.1]
MMSLKAYYLRVYGLLLAVIAGLVLVCWLVFAGLNQVRQQAYLDQLPEPLVKWLANHTASARLLLQSQSDLDYRILTAEEAELDSVTQERLGYGQVVSSRTGQGLRVYYSLPERQRVMVVDLREPYRTVVETGAFLISQALSAVPEEQRSDAAVTLGAAFGLWVRPVQSTGVIPGQEVLEQLADRGMAYYRPDADTAAKVFVRLQSGEVLEISGPPPFSPWAWPVVVILAVIAAATLAAVLYYMLSSLHQRLRSIENVVARIARGELDARVKAGDLSIAGRLGDSFNRMADHIERLVQVQREMIHAVSHELRTPVARIRFGVQMIEGSDEDEIRKQLTGIDADIQELDELIDEILTYARLEQGGPILAVQDINVKEVVEQVVREQQMTKPDLDIQAEFAEPSSQYAHSDVEPRYIHRAIQNLVGNATRYAKSRVLVQCHFNDQTCRVDVSDDGPGIPEQDWEKVFTAFARLDDSRTRSSGGYGLGLSIVRRILYWHGGQAFVGRSDALGGACFSLVWPRRYAG